MTKALKILDNKVKAISEVQNYSPFTFDRNLVLAVADGS